MTDFEAMPIAELLATRTALDAAIRKRQDQLERQLAELKGEKPEAVIEARPRLPRSRKTKRNGGKVAVMYRHPSTGQEWSGRGRPARWLSAEIAAGKSKEDFRV